MGEACSTHGRGKEDAESFVRQREGKGPRESARRM
jgi:hypothetical protein